MKILSPIFGLFLLVFAQHTTAQNYEKVDQTVDQYSPTITTPDELAALINRDFIAQDEKARAVFRWVATNISYDVALGQSMDFKSKNAYSYKTEKEKEAKEKKFQSDLILGTMQTRKGVCHGYSFLTEYLCEKVGLEAKTISGTLKSSPMQIGEIPGTPNHAWNVVKIGANWKFIDATIGAGSISGKTNLFKFQFNDAFFFTEPGIFFLNHFPEDEKWLLTTGHTKQEFASLPVFFGNYFQYKYTLTQLQSGILPATAPFICAIQGLNEYDTIEYSLSSQNRINYIEQENNTKDFSIDISGKNGDYLSLFVNGKIIAIYKVKA